MLKMKQGNELAFFPAGNTIMMNVSKVRLTDISLDKL